MLGAASSRQGAGRRGSGSGAKLLAMAADISGGIETAWLREVVDWLGLRLASLEVELSRGYQMEPGGPGEVATDVRWRLELRECTASEVPMREEPRKNRGGRCV